MPELHALVEKLHARLTAWLEHGVEMLPNAGLALLIVQAGEGLTSPSM